MCWGRCTELKRSPNCWRGECSRMFDASEFLNRSMFHIVIVSYIIQWARQACQVGRSNGCPKSKPNIGPSDLEKHLFQFHIQTILVHEVYLSHSFTFQQNQQSGRFIVVWYFCGDFSWAEALFAFGGCFLSPQLGRHCDRAPRSVMRRAAKEACNALHRVCAKKLEKICWLCFKDIPSFGFTHPATLGISIFELLYSRCITARVLVRTKRIFLLRRNKNLSPLIVPHHVSWIFMAAFLHLRGFCRWSSIAHWWQGFRVWTRYRLWRPSRAGRWKRTPFSP